MKILTKAKLGPHKYKTPEGYLVCMDCILGRTGEQEYRRSELWPDTKDDTVIKVVRDAKEVLAPETMASFENKPLTCEHPEEDVTPDNYKAYSVGFVRDIRPGKDGDIDVMLGNIVITDPDCINDVENHVRDELSCGYTCDITDEATPRQINIRGNHVALCEQGRAGNARIIDAMPGKKTFTVMWIYPDEDGEPYTGTSIVNASSEESAKAAVKKAHPKVTSMRVKPGRLMFEAEELWTDSDSNKKVHDEFVTYRGFVFEKPVQEPIGEFNGFYSPGKTETLGKYFITYEKNKHHNYMNTDGDSAGFALTFDGGTIRFNKDYNPKFAAAIQTVIEKAKKQFGTNNLVFDSVEDAAKNELSDMDIAELIFELNKLPADSVMYPIYFRKITEKFKAKGIDFKFIYVYSGINEEGELASVYRLDDLDKYAIIYNLGTHVQASIVNKVPAVIDDCVHEGFPIKRAGNEFLVDYEGKYRRFADSEKAKRFIETEIIGKAKAMLRDRLIKDEEYSDYFKKELSDLLKKKKEEIEEISDIDDPQTGEAFKKTKKKLLKKLKEQINNINE